MTKQLIDIDDLNDKINCLIGYLDMYEKGIRKPYELNSVLDEARTWIDSFPIESQWIDVKDKLPDEEGEYIICTSDGLVTPFAWSTDENNWIVGITNWRTTISGKITHWQPFPLPHK